MRRYWTEGGQRRESTKGDLNTVTQLLVRDKGRGLSGARRSPEREGRERVGRDEDLKIRVLGRKRERKRE